MDGWTVISKMVISNYTYYVIYLKTWLNFKLTKIITCNGNEWNKE